MFKFKRDGERRHARDAFWDEGPRDGRRGRRGHGPQGRRTRLFDQGDLRLVMLGFIAEAPPPRLRDHQTDRGQTERRL